MSFPRTINFLKEDLCVAARAGELLTIRSLSIETKTSDLGRKFSRKVKNFQNLNFSNTFCSLNKNFKFRRAVFEKTKKN